MNSGIEWLRNRARSLAFDLTAVCVPVRFSQWEAESGMKDAARLARLSPDPQEILPGAKSLILLASWFHPYCDGAADPSINAYYPVSNRSYQAVKALASDIQSLGCRAIPAPPLPLKPAFAGLGLAHYGRNGLLSFGEHGTRAALQMLLTDLPLPAERPSDAVRSPGEFCGGCDLCVRACPTGALRGNGRLDLERCLRAQPEGEPMPEAYRALIGNSLFGCDICQKACPRNRHVAPVPMPVDVAEALRLEKLLTGDVRELAAHLGRNYARPKRIAARACLVAANTERRDLIPLLEPLLSDSFEAVRVHARWALERLA
ncbi:MAG: 4Fe-4S binding protein [Clostridia bacterium]|nr:4Fe-4S binding protein [Clostridia bacterium]